VAFGQAAWVYSGLLSVVRGNHFPTAGDDLNGFSFSFDGIIAASSGLGANDISMRRRCRWSEMKSRSCNRLIEFDTGD